MLLPPDKVPSGCNCCPTITLLLKAIIARALPLLAAGLAFSGQSRYRRCWARR